MHGIEPSGERVDVPEQDMIDVKLEPRKVMSSGESSPVHGRIFVGRPHTQTLVSTPDGSRRLLSIPVNFVDSDDEPIVDATLGVALQYASAERSEHPVARDIDPRRLSRAVERSTTVSLSADLQFAEPGIERNVSDNGGEEFMTASGLGHHEVVWAFRRTPHQALAGIYDLRLVAEAAADEQVVALVALSASIQRRRLKVIQYRANLDPDLSVVRF